LNLHVRSRGDERLEVLIFGRLIGGRRANRTLLNLHVRSRRDERLEVPGTGGALCRFHADIEKKLDVIIQHSRGRLIRLFRL
jgi:hypothetical protein